MNNKGVKNHKWTDDDLDIVRCEYAGTNDSAERIARMLGVTLYGVKGQVQKLGIAKITDRVRWTEKEEERLAKLITQYSPSRLAKKMHRSVNSVVVKSKRMGLSRSFRDGWYTKKEVCEIFGKDHEWVQKRINDGTLPAEWHSAVKPEKNGGARWHIPRESIYRFLRKYPQDLNGRNVDLIQVVEILAGLTYTNE